MLQYNRFDSPQLPRWIAEILSQRHRIDPELGRVSIPVDMHVGQLVEVMTDEVESVRSWPQYSWAIYIFLVFMVLGEQSLSGWYAMLRQPCNSQQKSKESRERSGLAYMPKVESRRICWFRKSNGSLSHDGRTFSNLPSFRFRRPVVTRFETAIRRLL